MIPGMTSIGVRFDVDRIDSGSYGVACWKIFWQAVSPEKLGGTMLFEGDTAASMDGVENVFCIVVQGNDPDLVRLVKTALSDSEAYRQVCARPNFLEGNDCLREPLPAAGRIDYAGNLIGDAWNSRGALNAIRNTSAS